jgi:hypothetical protein
VQAFSTLSDVQDFFGASSTEATLAAVYFSGFEGATTLPGTLYFAQFNDADVGAYLRSASLEGMTLAQLQALSGVLVITIDGRVNTSSTINLSSATSFSSAATLIQTGLQSATAIFQGTAEQDEYDTTMTVTAVTSGALHVGDVIAGTGVTSGSAVVQQLTGTPGGIGTYELTTGDGFATTAINVAGASTVTYDSQLHAFVVHSPTVGVDSTIGYASGSLSTGLKLTSATDAVLSQGADEAVPAELMAAIVDITQNWAAFLTTFELNDAGKLDFADWVTTTNDRYVYVCSDSDTGPVLSNDDADSFGRLTADYDGVVPVYDPTLKIAAFICGTIASINFTELNGRTSFAYRGQSGLAADITNATEANNLIANGYNFYGQYATANDSFVMLQDGQISGQWKWIDRYVNQIQLNAAFQLAFMTLLTQIKSVPYNIRGYNLLRAAAQDPINAALNFGTIQPGINLSASQIAQLNTAAGQPIADTVKNAGYYLQILDAPPEVRAVRGSPPMTFWYTDGGSVQKITLSSIDVE